MIRIIILEIVTGSSERVSMRSSSRQPNPRNK